MSVVKAKFKVNSIEQFETQKRVKMSAVYGTGENADFCKYTPSGIFEMSIDKEAPTASQFEVGKSYYLTFEEATIQGTGFCSHILLIKRRVLLFLAGLFICPFTALLIVSPQQYEYN